MPQLTASRLAAIAITFALGALAPTRGVFAAVTLGVALGHYLLGYIYARSQIARACSRWRSAIALLALAATGAAFYFGGLSIVWPFALHHALNEVFLLDRFTANARLLSVRVLRGAGFLFHLALYIVFVRTSFTFWHNVDHLLAFLTLTGAFYAVALFVARRSLSVVELAGHTIVEIVMLAVLTLSFSTPINVLHVACYHFAQWAIFPATQLVTHKRFRGLVVYITATILITAAFIAVSPLYLTPWVLTGSAFQMLFTLFSHIHITTSFVLSRTNPRFVTRFAEALQRPASAAVAGPA